MSLKPCYLETTKENILSYGLKNSYTVPAMYPFIKPYKDKVVPATIILPNKFMDVKLYQRLSKIF